MATASSAASRPYAERVSPRLIAASVAATLALAACGAPLDDAASPHPDDARCGPLSVPAEQVSVGLFSYWNWITEAGPDEVLGAIADAGITHVEPFGAPRDAFSSYGDLDAAEYRALLDAHGLAAPSAHGSVDEARFDRELATATTLGQEYVGSGGWPLPGLGSYEEVLATADALNRLGAASVAAGTGPVFGHNHSEEFTSVFADPETGTEASAWEILADHTDPDLVTFELDVYWAVSAGVDVPDLLERYGDRVALLHVKDGVAPYGEDDITGLGEGDIDFAPILAAAQGHVAYYVMEYDFAPSDATFARDGFAFLTCFEG